jgi:cobalt/nickel transport system ATP-binding protein
LLLDEPMAGLDPRSQAQLLDILEQLHTQAGITIVTATHDLTTLPHLADRAIVLNEEHRIVADASTSAVLTDLDMLLSVNLIHAHTHRHGEIIHNHPHQHVIAHDHKHAE